MNIAPAPHSRPLEDGDRPSIRIFYSYADADKKWLTDLSTHLNATPGTDMDIQEFYRGKTIIAGENEDKVIRQQVQQAHLILLLISSDFMSDAHHESAEMQEILSLLKEKEGRRRKVFIPILAHPTALWKSEEKVAPFVALKSLPSNQKPIDKWRNKDKAFENVVQGIKEAIEDPKNRWIFRPFSTLPPRNPIFTGREELLAQIYDKLKQGILPKFRRPLAIFGLGGVGKTQLAIEYAYSNSKLYQNIFFVHANNLQTLTADYATIATALGLVRSREPDAELIKERMRRWLENNDKWLLIFDNADNKEAIEGFIPDQAKGDILLTTQNPDWEKSIGTLEIEAMQYNEGATLLLRRAGRIAADQSVENIKDENEQNLAVDIAELLGGLPLAIDQAGAFMKATNYSLSGYAQLYREQQQRLKLLKMRGIISSQDDHPEAFLVTFSMAFRRVKRLAADMLRLCAFLAPDDIPNTLITRDLARLPSFSDRVFKPEDLIDAIKALTGYSLINADPDNNPADASNTTVNIHRLVQTVLRDSMYKKEGLQRTWAIRAANLVSLAFPTSIEVSTWPQCQLLLPHVQVCAKWIEEFNLTTSQVSRLLDDSGYYLFQRGLYREAKLLIEQALRIRQRTGARDIFVAQSLHRLGEVNEREGNYADAEQNLQQALEIREQQDQKAAYTADSLKSLAEVYRKRKKYTQAKQLYEQALKIYEQTLAEIDPQSTASAFNAVWNELVKLYNNLALLQQDLREFDRADELYQQALKMAKNAWGEENPTTAQILHDRAELFKKQGKLEEAERLHLQALDIRRRVEEEQRKRTTGSLRVQRLDSGELDQEVESRDIAMSLNSLGALYMRQGKREKAEKFYKDALKMRRKILGSENPETAESLYGLGKLYRYSNRAQEAEEKYQQALKIQEKRPGLGDSATLDTQKALADLYQSRGWEEEAEEVHRKGLNGRYEQLRLDDFTIKKNLEYLAKLYQSQHKAAKEVDLYKEAFSKYARRFGPDDALTQEYRQKLLDCYKSGTAIDGNLLWLYTQDFDQRARYLRRDNSQTVKDFIQSVKVLADVYNSQRQTRKLKELYDLALHICHQQLGAGHPVTLWYQNALLSLPDDTRIPLQRGRKYRPSRKPVKKAGNNTNILSDTKKAPEIAPEQVQERGQKLEKQLLEAYNQSGVDGPDAVKRRRELVRFYEENGEPEKTERVYRQALNLCLLDLGPYHMTTLECQNELARCYWLHEKYDEAKPLIQEVLAICQPMLEEEDDLSEKDILTCIHSLDNAAFLYLRELDTRQLNIRRRHWLGGELTRAEALIQQALEICRERLGEKHAETITIRERYAALLREMGLYDKAEVITISTRLMQEKAEENNQPAEQQVGENNQLSAKELTSF